MKIINIPEGAWDHMDGPRLPAGTYQAVVSKVEDKQKDGADQILLELSTPEGARICGDILTFSDKAMGISLAKIQAMGIPKGAKAFTGDELLNKRVRVYVMESPYVDKNGQSRTSLKVDISQGSNKGYDPGEPGF